MKNITYKREYRSGLIGKTARYDRLRESLDAMLELDGDMVRIECKDTAEARKVAYGIQAAERSIPDWRLRPYKLDAFRTHDTVFVRKVSKGR